MLIFGKSERGLLISKKQRHFRQFYLKSFFRSEDKSDGEARAKEVIREK